VTTPVANVAVSRPEEAMPLSSINPATGETLQTFPELSDDELEQRLELAARAFREHRSGSRSQRAAAMATAGRLLDSEKRLFARLLV
jgi:succinate-semialdehyde dehydrogenase / glutarate-semialdehyde dehydrogenase